MVGRMTVISGGQTGVDQAALRAARALGFRTGGSAPKDWQTEAGPAPWLADYGLVDSGLGYFARTRLNVDNAHATLIVVDRGPLTGGTLQTQEYAEGAIETAIAKNRPHAGLCVPEMDVDTPAVVLEWLVACWSKNNTLNGHPWFVLNVAGPRESKATGIGARAELYLERVLRAMRLYL